MTLFRVVSEIFNVEICRDLEIWVKGQRSLTVIATVTDRSATNNFLLTFRSNHGPISHRSRDRRQFQSKINNHPTPFILCPRWRGSPWNWASAPRTKNRLMGLLGLERSLLMSSAFWIQSTNVTAGRTDRHRATAKTALTHSVAR